MANSKGINISIDKDELVVGTTYELQSEGETHAEDDMGETPQGDLSGDNQ
jgi:hypothetical protein